MFKRIFASEMDLQDIETWLDEHDTDWWALMGALAEALKDESFSDEIESRL